MEVQIVIKNPSIDMLATLAAVLHGAQIEAAVGGCMGDCAGSAADPSEGPAPTADPVPTRFTTGHREGDRVHWKGEKYEFDGEIIEVLNTSFADSPYLRIRRDDTGKVARLTRADLEVGVLTQLGAVSHDLEGDVATLTKIRTVEDLDALGEGDDVHWKGAKYEFDGVVTEVKNYVFDEDDDPDTKVVFVRRNDTSKLVSLTFSDLQTGELTYL